MRYVVKYWILHGGSFSGWESNYMSYEYKNDALEFMQKTNKGKEKHYHCKLYVEDKE